MDIVIGVALVAILVLVVIGGAMKGFDEQRDLREKRQERKRIRERDEREDRANRI